MIQPISKYKLWLGLVCKYFSITPEEIKSRKMDAYTRQARQTFLVLCVMDKICLYRLAIEFGKHRTTLIGIVKNYKGEVTEHVNKIYETQNKRSS